MDRPPRSPMPSRSPSALSSVSLPPSTGKPDAQDRGSSLKQTRQSASNTSTPLSSAPQASIPGSHAPHTPTPTSSRRQSSSSQSLRASASSPRLAKRSSRSSLGSAANAQQSEDQRNGATPKRSISNLISGLRESQASMASIPEPVVLTAPDIAKAHFKREMERMEEGVESETLIVLHDACYRHRFSRPKTSRSGLSMIVERPERLHAAVLGAAAAYVRLGEHCDGGGNAPHPDRVVDGPGRMGIRRTRRAMEVTSSYVTNVHGTEWMGELRGMCEVAEERLAKGEKELGRGFEASGKEKRELHSGDLYLCPGSLDAFQGALGGVAEAVDAVFSPSTHIKRAFAAVRPPGHHCSADYPSGFCWLNNVHVGLEYAAQTQGLTHAAIIDFDLHHGDGSQAITWERNRKNNEKRINAKPTSKLKLGPDIGYYSLHDINSYPCEMGDDEKVQAASLCVENAHSQSVWNVHLQAWKTEEEFWALYEGRYQVLLDKARLFLRHHTARLRAEGKMRPKAAVFISAGFDASEWEGAGMQRHKVSVPTDFYARFTRDVVKLAQEEETGCSGRVISVLEGGYSDRALCSGVMSHLSGLCAPANTPVVPSSTNGLSDPFSLEQQMNSLSLTNPEKDYEPSWWSADNLAALEEKVNPPPPPPQNKKYRTGPTPTYATPTESFAYKVVDPNKFALSISGTMREAAPNGPEMPKLPPAPSVDWILATQTFTELLVPQEGVTKSCTAEQLAGPKATKAPAVAVEWEKTREAGDGSRQLRNRTKPSYSQSPEQLRVPSRVSNRSGADSRADRRRTIADLPLGTDPMARRSSRRSSMASTVVDSEAGGGEAPPVPAMPPLSGKENGTMEPPPVAGQADGVQVKKTRAPPKLKKAVSSQHRAPKSAPVSPAARAGITTSAPDAANAAAAPNMPPPATAAPKPSVTTGPQQNGALQPSRPSGSSDVDALTTGMKKVTLKAPTREEHDRKLKEKVDAERRARALKGAQTRRDNAARKEKARVADTADGAGEVSRGAVKEAAPTAPPALDRGADAALPAFASTETAGMESSLPDVQGMVPAANTQQPSEASSAASQVGFPSVPAPTPSGDVMEVEQTAATVPKLAGGGMPIPSAGFQSPAAPPAPAMALEEPHVEAPAVGTCAVEAPVVETPATVVAQSAFVPQVESQPETQQPTLAEAGPRLQASASEPSSAVDAMSQIPTSTVSQPAQPSVPKQTFEQQPPSFTPSLSPTAPESSAPSNQEPLPAPRPVLQPTRTYSYTYVDTGGDPARIPSPHNRVPSPYNRPSSGAKGRQLPRFSATGVIPFADAGRKATSPLRDGGFLGDGESEKLDGKSDGEGKETPAK